MDATELVGRWNFVRGGMELPDGTLVTPCNQGWLAYWADGTMMAILDHSDRGERPSPGGPASTPNDSAVTPSEQILALAQGQFTAYAGTYTLDGDVVTHHVWFASNAPSKGHDLRRRIHFERGQLVLSTRNLDQGMNADLVWERANSI